MSMCLGLVALSDANIARVLADPPLVWRVVAPDDPEAFEGARAAQAKPSLFSKLFGNARHTDGLSDLEMSPPEGISADIEKAWHGIHYLLTGTAWEGEHPRNFLVSGGKEVGTIDVGYGPARVLTAAKTREVRDALMALSDEDLKARFDPEDMLAKQVYPEIWERDPEEDDTLGYLMENVQTLRGFLNQAVDKGLGIVVYLS
jgi:hypothetical protein